MCVRPQQLSPRLAGDSHASSQTQILTTVHERKAITMRAFQANGRRGAELRKP